MSDDEADDFEPPIEVDGPVVLRKSEWLDDWYVVERRHHAHAVAVVPVTRGVMALFDSSRVSDADVEGTREHMVALAKAIRDRGRFSERRCAVDATDERVLLWSPRNSIRPASVTREAADALAAQIEAELITIK